MPGPMKTLETVNKVISSHICSKIRKTCMRMRNKMQTLITSGEGGREENGWGYKEGLDSICNVYFKFISEREKLSILF